MFRYGTTFVIGAGASAEFGMPVGSELAKRIKRSALLTNLGNRNPNVGDDFLYDTVTRLWRQATRQKAVDAARTIHEGIHTAVSIDAFIDRFSGDDDIVFMGKMLIALEITKAEAESSMAPAYWERFEADPKAFVQNSFGTALSNPDDTWIGHFFRILCDGVRDPKDLGKNISIICFNYDRCIENYLRKQIAAAYRLPISEAQQIVESIEIIHPYGTLGELPQTEYGHGDGILAFGAKRDHQLLLEEVAKSIRTYTEQQHDPKTIKRIHDAMEQCKVLTFLGFGFNNQNLDLLRVSHLERPNDKPTTIVYSSGLGVAEQVETTLKGRISHLFWDEENSRDQRQRIHIEYGQTCAQLFSTHNMNFSSFSRAYFVNVEAENRSQRVIIAERSDG